MAQGAGPGHNRVPVKKRQVALALVALVLALAIGSVAVLRTAWAGERICRLAAAELSRATGLAASFGGCTVDPLALAVSASAVRVGDVRHPVFTAESLEARLAPVQALGGRVHLDRVRAVRPRLEAALPGGGGGTCPPPALAGLDVQRLEIVDGAVALTLAGGQRVEAEGIQVAAAPVPRPRLALPRPQRRVRVEASTGAVRVGDKAGRAFRADRVAIRGELALDLSSAVIAGAEASGEGISAVVHGRIDDLCAPRLALSGTIRSDAPALAALAGRAGADVAGEVAADVRVEGPVRAPAISGAVHFRGLRLGAYAPGAGWAKLRLEKDRIAVERLEVRLDSGVVAASGTVALARGFPVDAELELGGVDLAEILQRVDVTDAWTSVRLQGGGAVQGTLWPVALEGNLALDWRDLRVENRSWRRWAAGDAAILHVKRGRVETPVRADREGLYFDGARLTSGDGAVAVDATVGFREATGFRARARGEVDLAAVGPLAEIPWSGLASVDAAIDGAPYGRVRADARVRAERFRYLDLDLGTLTANVSCDQFLLHLADVQGVRGGSRYRGDALVDLDRTPTWVVSSRMSGQGRIRDLLDAVRDYLPRTRFLRDVLDGDVEVTAGASGPAAALDATYDARLGAGTLYGRAFDGGRAEGRITRAEQVFLDRGELRRGDGVARAHGSWGTLPPFPWNLEVSLAGLALADAGIPGPRWAGTARGSATLAGSFEKPDVRFALAGDGVAVAGVPLGAVQVEGTLRDRFTVSGAGEGIRFSGDAALDGRMPFRARAELASDDLARLFPGAPAGLRAGVTGVVTAEGELADAADLRADARLDRLGVVLGDFRVENDGPVRIAVDHRRVELQALALRGTNTQFSLTGSRSAAGQLDLSAAGALDLRLLDGLLPQVRRPYGRLAVEAHVGGTAADPLLVGAGQVSDAGFALRGASIAFEGVRGDLAFSQNRVLFDDLSAAVNGGRAGLRGEVELSDFVPARLRVEVRLDEVPVAVPAWLPATISGRVEASGTPDATTVSGRIRVIRARYTQNVELEKTLLELKRRPPAPPRAYDKAGEWLRFDVQVVVDGDVRVENDLVRGDVRGDLTATGTLAAPGLVGTLSMGEDSRATFRGNEFELTHALIDFTDRHSVAMALDVHGEAQVRDYQVYMHLFGPFEDPQLQLTSTPALSQPDIITLLSLGFTTRDAVAGAGVGGVATAAAAQALFSASGLDDQVKRFVPRGSLLRDFSVRITSAYSETRGQVEPLAEFESWLWHDRLRLRYQAPLSGAVGQRAEAEVRLGGHTALQYQWDPNNPDVTTPTGDHGVDLKLRWEWND